MPMQCIITQFQLLIHAERDLLNQQYSNLMVYYPQWRAPFPPDLILHEEQIKIAVNPEHEYEFIY